MYDHGGTVFSLDKTLPSDLQPQITEFKTLANQFLQLLRLDNPTIQVYTTHHTGIYKVYTTTPYRYIQPHHIYRYMQPHHTGHIQPHHTGIYNPPYRYIQPTILVIYNPPYRYIQPTILVIYNPPYRYIQPTIQVCTTHLSLIE